jgi:hypothetical protein
VHGRLANSPPWRPALEPGIDRRARDAGGLGRGLNVRLVDEGRQQLLLPGTQTGRLVVAVGGRAHAVRVICRSGAGGGLRRDLSLIRLSCHTIILSLIPFPLLLLPLTPGLDSLY